jgi:hypothetical protein
LSTPLDPHESAAERLALSRERMRQVMLAAHPQASGAQGGGMPGWLQALTEIPLLGAVVDAVHGWWAQHPMHLAVKVAGDAGKTLIRPLAQRHPIGLVFVAMLAGAVLARTRPWRRLVKPAIFAGLLTQIASKVIAHVPIESWISAIGSLTEPSEPATPPAARATEKAPAATQAQAAPQTQAVVPPPHDAAPRPTTLH